MKRHDPDDYRMVEDAKGDYVEFTDLQALAKESLARAWHKDECEDGNENCTCDRDSFLAQLKAIIEAKP